MSLINNMIDIVMDKRFQQKDYKETKYSISKVFKESGNGIYGCHLIGENNDFTSKAIRLVSGKYVHSILVWHDEEGIMKNLNNDAIARLKYKFNSYYKNFPFLDFLKTKTLVLGSADSNGMNYFDFSNYHDRQFILNKIPLEEYQIKELVNYMLKHENMHRKYDYTGLFFWLFRLFDDEKSWYCSEQYNNVLRYIGYDMEFKKDPSPTQNAEWIIKNVPETIILDTRE